MDKAFRSEYARLAREHWWWRARRRFLEGELARLDWSGAPAALDVGCGDGAFLEVLARFAAAHGLEPDSELVDPNGPRRERITVGALDDSYRAPRPLRCVTLLDVLEHVDDRAACLRRASALLEVGGALVLTVPAGPTLWTRHDELNEHRLRYTRRGLVAELEAAGLRVERVRHFFHWLAPAKLVVRALEAARHSAPSPPRVPPRWINGALDALCRIEQASWGRLAPPFGGSLLAIARSPEVETGRAGTSAPEPAQ